MIRLSRWATGPATGNRQGAPAVQPFYARMLRLRHVHPGGLLCFLFFEATIALAVLLALAEFVPWTVIPVLPVTVAAFVKVNDLVAGASARSRPRRSFPAQAAYALGASYQPRVAYALEAGPARSGLYGTPLALPPGRDVPAAPPALPPARGVATVDVPAPTDRSTSTVYGAPAAVTAVPTARGRHGRPTGVVYHTSPR